MKCIKLLLLGLLFLPISAFAATSDGVISRMTTAGKITDSQAREQFDLVFASIKEELKAGGQIGVKNFGRFYIQNRTERTGRNPKTGAALKIPARRYVRFTSNDAFKEELNPNIPKSIAVIADEPAETAQTTPEVKQ